MCILYIIHFYIYRTILRKIIYKLLMLIIFLYFNLCCKLLCKRNSKTFYLGFEKIYIFSEKIRFQRKVLQKVHIRLNIFYNFYIFYILYSFLFPDISIATFVPYVFLLLQVKSKVYSKIIFTLRSFWNQILLIISIYTAIYSMAQI